MKSNIFLRVIIGVSILFWSFCVQATPVAKQDALKFANTIGKELVTDFQEKNLTKRYQKLDEVLIKHVDMEYIAKFVIGKYWRIMTPKQQQRYIEIFKRYGMAYYKTLPLDFASSLTYKVVNAEIDGKFTNVAAEVSFNLNSQPQKMGLIFRIHESGGIIKAVDVKVAESSMLLVYRNKIYQMIAEDDEEIDWFLEDLEDTTSSWEESLKESSPKPQKSLEIGKENL